MKHTCYPWVGRKMGLSVCGGHTAADVVCMCKCRCENKGSV